MTAPDAVWDYADDLRRFAAHLCRHPQDAEDVAQSTLMKAAQHIDGFRGEASVRTWLHTIATNECRMLRRRTPPGALDDALESAVSAGRRGPLPVVPADPEDLAMEAETRREVVDALTRLPEHYQKVLVLKDGCGLRSAEVARLLETTVPAAKSILFRARRSLRDALAAG
ncbi:MAG: sigma-70 family RNA polymerase sigma factor [Actinobacteria bacterium]|nr:sigma-70 family RNA polymerase sigma factor [Actinomycetota bacterium]